MKITIGVGNEFDSNKTILTVFLTHGEKLYHSAHLLNDECIIETLNEQNILSYIVDMVAVAVNACLNRMENES
jgi:hypothetical protein